VGISAGFASVFGTPLAGAVFALEIMLIQQLNYRMVLPVFLSAYLAAYVCNLWGVQHTHYHLGAVPAITFTHLCWTLLVGLLSGLTARLFSASTHFCTDFFKNWINYPPLRPLAGGAVLALVIYFTASDKYIGLGVPTIVAAFSEPMNGYDFLLKILFTAFTLGAGFKGGEVTPLFFIGATLGNALIWFIPLPLGLLAGMGFVAVFSGATHAPLACALMGMELFGIESGVYLTIACITAYFFSGEKGIYSSQQVGNPKRWLHQRLKLIFPSKIKTS
jgi:H+/Cl- antiporter ClcA